MKSKIEKFYYSYVAGILAMGLPVTALIAIWSDSEWSSNMFYSNIVLIICWMIYERSLDK